MKPTGRASEPAERALKLAGRAPKPGGSPLGVGQTNGNNKNKKTERVSLCGDAIGQGGPLLKEGEQEREIEDEQEWTVISSYSARKETM